MKDEPKDLCRKCDGAGRYYQSDSYHGGWQMVQCSGCGGSGWEADRLARAAANRAEASNAR